MQRGRQGHESSMPCDVRHETLLDLHVLHQLRRKGLSEAFLAKMARSFDEYAEKFEAMEHALAANDSHAFRAIVHSMKAGVGTVGATRLFKLLECVYNATDECLVLHKDDWMPDLVATFQHTQSALHAALTEPDPLRSER